MTLFKASDDLSGNLLDATLGWSDWAEGGVDVQLVPGNHATMVYKPNVETLADKLAECIAKVQSDLEYPADRIEPLNELRKDSQ